jgi:hypothetical protein
MGDFLVTNVKPIMEITAIAAIPLGLLFSFIIALRRGMGPRIIQFAGAVTLIPIVFVLAMEKAFEAATLGVLIGTMVGFVLSGVGELFAPPRPPA